ncbi:MAG: hypothetical protein FAZ92_02622 [Accumulibacter sp.]|nr:MAG: hypothetical protein FAZ92_02622 [Accumulibacter sp.]
MTLPRCGKQGGGGSRFLPREGDDLQLPDRQPLFEPEDRGVEQPWQQVLECDLLVAGRQQRHGDAVDVEAALAVAVGDDEVVQATEDEADAVLDVRPLVAGVGDECRIQRLEADDAAKVESAGKLRRQRLRQPAAEADALILLFPAGDCAHVETTLEEAAEQRSGVRRIAVGKGRDDQRVDRVRRRNRRQVAGKELDAGFLPVAPVGQHRQFVNDLHALPPATRWANRWRPYGNAAAPAAGPPCGCRSVAAAVPVARAAPDC